MPTVTVTVRDSAGNVSAPASASWTVNTSAPLKIIGMSAPVSDWSQRLAEVGPAGVNARRIFGDIVSNGRSQQALIEQAIAQGHTPVVSYKVASPSAFAAGTSDAAGLAATRAYLESLGVELTATWWHEPHGDMTAAQFRDGSARFMAAMQTPNIKVGPILNGWLLDNQVSTWTSYTSPALLDGWDFLGVDTYQAGTTAAPDNSKLPGRAVPLAASWLAGQGHASMPIVVGEYNGFTTAAIQYAGETVLSSPNVWIACVWNSSGGLGVPLSGARLAAFQATKADPRALN